MAEHVRMDTFADPGMLCVAMKAFPHALGMQPYRVFPLRDKQCRIVIVADIKILPNPSKSSVREVDFARFVAFADDLGHLRFPINLGTIQGQCFGNTHPRDTENLCQGTVTQARLGMRWNTIEESLDFLFGEILHLVFGDLGPAYLLGGRRPETHEPLCSSRENS